MRWIGPFANFEAAQRFVQHLASIGIEAAAEKLSDQECRIWVVSEDEMDRVQALFQEFSADPQNSRFDSAPVHRPLDDLSEAGSEAEPVRSRVSWGWVVPLISAIAVVIFLVQQWEESQVAELRPKELSQIPFITPIEEALLISTPVAALAVQTAAIDFEQQDSVISEQQIESILASTPQFSGLWGMLEQRIGLQPTSPSGPILPEVQHGQVWRLFTPALLHAHLLHIGFNLLWFIYLGRHIEYRIGAGRTLLLVVLSAIVSNVAQYIMTGPLFYGLSGVAVALAGFVWMRESLAPWEGYPIPRTTLHFLAGFVLLAAVVDGLLLLTQFIQGPLALGIRLANTAHIVGGLVGILLGRLTLMRKRSMFDQQGR